MVENFEPPIRLLKNLQSETFTLKILIRVVWFLGVPNNTSKRRSIKFNRSWLKSVRAFYVNKKLRECPASALCFFNPSRYLTNSVFNLTRGLQKIVEKMSWPKNVDLCMFSHNSNDKTTTAKTLRKSRTFL